MEALMVILRSDNLKVSLRVRVGRITDEMIYFTGDQFEWCKTEITPVLINDLKQATGSENALLWFGKRIEIYSDNQNVRARLPAGKDN